MYEQTHKLPRSFKHRLLIFRYYSITIIKVIRK